MFTFPLSKFILYPLHRITMGSAAKLDYPEESFPTLKPAFVVKVLGITNKYSAGPVHASGGLFAVVSLPAFSSSMAAGVKTR